jgi:hypothetical protein
MSYLVKLRRSAEKELDRLPEKTHDRIVIVLKALEENLLYRAFLNCLQCRVCLLREMGGVGVCTLFTMIRQIFFTSGLTIKSRM